MKMEASQRKDKSCFIWDSEEEKQEKKKKKKQGYLNFNSRKLLRKYLDAHIWKVHQVLGKINPRQTT